MDPLIKNYSSPSELTNQPVSKQEASKQTTKTNQIDSNLLKSKIEHEPPATNSNFVSQAVQSVKEQHNAPGEAIEKESPNVKSKFPMFDTLTDALDIRKSADKDVIDNAIKTIHNSRAPSKAEIAYSLIEHQTDKLGKVSKLTREIKDPGEAKKYFSEQMTKLGYKAVPITVKEESGNEYQLTGWTKPESNFMVHTCPFWLINSKVSKPMANPKLRDENFLLNNNDKLCVSALNSERGRMFQPDKRAGIIMKIPPQSILDTYAADRLSPVGFKKSKEEVAKMSDQEKVSYEKQLKDVDNFINHLRRYHALCSYTKNLGEGLVQVILAENTDLTSQERIHLQNFLAGLDQGTKKALLNPKDASFEEIPALVDYLDQLKEIYQKYGTPYKDTLGKLIYGNSSIDVGKQLEQITTFSKEMLKDNKKWKDTNIHPSASKWEKAIREGGETFAARLMPAGIHGPTSLSHVGENENDRFVELNVSTKNTDLAGFLIDPCHFSSQESQTLNIDLAKFKNIKEEVVDPLTKQITDLKEQKAKLKAGSSEETTLTSQINQLERELAIATNSQEVVNLMKYASDNFIPFIVMGDQG